ncbi:MAG: efflux RND transporter permease subunit, partial [Candidatus Eremiobacteraeota bacterium]|nr:efflux RND transporter permease subunit [Candidatus Eremiobacteraeota bacterium]
FAKTLQERGRPLGDAIIEAGQSRLRPILMTALSTVVGMVPMATGLGSGGDTNGPLALAVIGGLTVSTVLTLLVLPLFYQMAAARVSPRVPGPTSDRTG